MEVREVLLGNRDGFGFVGDRDVDDAVRHLHRHGPDLVGMEHAETAAFDHRGTAHADARVRGRDHDVAAAEQRGVAGEAATRVDPDERHEAAQRAEQVERHAVEPGEPGAVGVAGPAAAALGEEDDRKPHAFRELEQPVLLAMVLQPLCAGEHRVVVRHHDAAGLAVGEQGTVDPAHAGDEAVGRSARDQIVQRSASTLCRDHE